MSKINKTENRYNKLYTESEDRTILLWVSKGATFDEIAAKLGNGRTANGISQRYRYIIDGHKKPSNNVPDEEAEKIIRLHFGGKKQSEIIRETGWSDRTVARVTRIADMAIRLNQKTEEHKPMKTFKRERCALCGEPLTADNALKLGKMLICNNPVCMKLKITDREYSELCIEFSEDIWPELFYHWLSEAYFDKPDEDEIEYFEEYEPERDEE